jgi:protein-tyrosine-phosphatase
MGARKERLLLFVCTGNVCRSPMAEYMMRRFLPPGSGWEVTSAGTLAAYGIPASPEAVRVLQENGTDLRGHLSRPLTRERVDAADVVVVMTAAHRDQLLLGFPDAREKIFLLRSFDPGSGDCPDVMDPFGMPLEDYREAYDVIARALPELAVFLRELQVKDANPPGGKDTGHRPAGDRRP